MLGLFDKGFIQLLNLYITQFRLLMTPPPQERSLLKTVWEKEKMLVTTMFSTQSKTEIMWAAFVFLSANALNLMTFDFFSIGKELTT